MATSNGNAYPTWGIDIQGHIFAVDTNNQVHSKSSNSNPTFFDIGISEDGHVWALANEADPDGGGAKVYWSTGDGTWNEIATSAPGGVRISGFTGSSCIYVTSSAVLMSCDTVGTSSTVYDTHPIHDADYGGGYIWALLSDKPGEVIKLHLTQSDSIDFKSYNTGNVFPTSLSVLPDGDCYGIDNYCAVHYHKDGTSTPGGLKLCGKTLSVSYKSWKYALGLEATEKGNEAYVWKGEDITGEFILTGYQAIRILSSYYLP